jgi:hypothetical protein
MRMMVKITMPVEGGNHAVKAGLLPKLIQQTVELIKPEAAYFTPHHGQRTAYFFFDMKDSSQMPVIAEPWFSGVNALVEFQPVMNSEDLRAGLDTATKK